MPFPMTPSLPPCPTDFDKICQLILYPRRWLSVPCAGNAAALPTPPCLSPDRSISSENIYSSFSEGQEVDVRIMEVNTGNNKMSLSMLPPTEEAGEQELSAYHLLFHFTGVATFLVCV